MLLKNTKTIITGGANGIGKAAVRRFLDEGASVTVWDVNEQAGEQLRAEFSSKQLIFQKVNVADLQQVHAAAKQAREQMGGLDVLINNAGITRDATLLKMEEEQWDAVISVNLKGVFNCGQAAAALMAESGKGVIVNTASVVALYGNFGQSNYVAAKAGVVGLTKTWARELGRKGIRVNAIAPGFIATEMVNSIPEKVISMLEEKTPLQRLGLPQDIANAMVFLSSEQASFITGTVLSVDGGLVL